MRISDWSSDVCSSDLHLPQRGIGIGVGRSRNGHGRGEFGITKRREGTREARDDERYQHRRPGERRRRGAGRSEEHTSELQSLMRISYAVFCLKKKKKTILKCNNRLQNDIAAPI